MKKTKTVTVVILILSLLISLKFNINTLSREKQNRATTITHLYTTITNTSSNLNAFIISYEDKNMKDAKIYLEYASTNLRKAQDIIIYTNIYDKKSIYEPGIFSFDFIADLLTITTHKVNGIMINSILSDDKISDKEFSFIKKLNNDLEQLSKSFTLSNPIKINTDLTTDEINNILNKFYSVWNLNEDIYDSPYKLLVNQ